MFQIIFSLFIVAFIGWCFYLWMIGKGFDIKDNKPESLRQVINNEAKKQAQSSNEQRTRA